MTWVKVCGLRTPTDVDAAVNAGADAIGFVLAPSSPRYVTQSQAAALGKEVEILTVIVTVDLTAPELLAAVETTGAGGVQPHGAYRREAARRAQAEGLFVLHPVPVRGSIDVSDIDEGQIPLLDSYRAGAQGGTGEVFDWETIPDLGRRFVLAGGLGPENIGEVIRLVAPWGVDASSGLESAPGVKNPHRIRRYVERARD